MKIRPVFHIAGEQPGDEAAEVVEDSSSSETTDTQSIQGDQPRQHAVNQRHKLNMALGER